MLKKRKVKNKIIILFLIAFIYQWDVFAGGISVDAGITPPQDRFILRAQYRFMSMENSMLTMHTHMTPLVLAYGVTPGFTVMVRSMYIHQVAENNQMINNGINDLFLLSKFRLYRKNAPNYVFGIAPHIATNIPVGSSEISNRTWNPELGINISFRPRFFAADMSTSCIFSDVSGKLGAKPGNIFNLNTAFSALIPLKSQSERAISPVVEMTYSHQGKSKTNPMNDILFISPGFSYIHSNLTLEILCQIPVYQSNDASVMNHNSRWILGVKYMF